MYYLNRKIENLVRIFDQNERKSYLRLDLNENPGGLPEEFVNGVLGDVTPQLIAQYPETLHFTEVLAQYLGTDIQHLCLVNGSAEGIRYIIQAFTSENGKIVGVVPSYFMFQVYSEMYGRNFVKVPYNKDLTMSIENIITQLTDDTQLSLYHHGFNLVISLGNRHASRTLSSPIIFMVRRSRPIPRPPWGGIPYLKQSR